MSVDNSSESLPSEHRVESEYQSINQDEVKSIINPHVVDELDSILDWVRYSVSVFYQAGVFFGHGTDNEWDEACSLVYQAANVPLDTAPLRQELLYQAKLTKDEKARIIDWLQQRVELQRPLPYITNQAWFAGMPFYVDERVLIPRSPFAELIQQGFKPWLSSSPSHILDLCTGGACIAIALADSFEDAIVDGADIDSDALDVASMNIYEYQLEDRVFPLQSDLFAGLEGQRYDLIVSNPPYVDQQDMDDLPDEFRHEPEHALAAGVDGLDLVDIMLKQAPNYMQDQAWIFVEVGNSEVHMTTRFPGLEVEWVELSSGGSGIFAVQKEVLQAYWSSVE
ncbi:50S ribosomal protein L3 N(5)-glutamine methyltransferase [Glaciecola sp. MH2013]|uniref:50S ribosomal protein L3 N(5)-glutamine methyltransferase n=1 Tax=Glaciecola sp. MH2013 TaxID=2785524 RepID=UPI0018A03170|nr:50S ribosomal protein L3 N(5)-glutamine methyltransferase [Glaciecola sp. MH2013]MBF7072467.1 50S ribosomal protein L3 N(5)-glutamine methyltransferase [Glaciecola sp. MH2013]